MIPKIIHQTWKSRALPPNFKKWSETFDRLMPDWERRLWTDEDCLKFITDESAELAAIYQQLPNIGQKADLFRYMAVCKFGGLYVDIDCECKRPLDFIAPDDTFIIATELKTSSPRVMGLYQTDVNDVYCMWAFLAVPQHPILVSLIDEIRRTAHQKFSDNAILDGVKRTGPHAFTRAVKRFTSEGGRIKLLPGEYFGCCDGRNTFRFAFSFLFPEWFRKVYIRHHFQASWMDPKVKREMLRRNLTFANRVPGAELQANQRAR